MKYAYLSLVLASTTFDLLSIKTPVGNLKLAYLFCLPFIRLVTFNYLVRYFHANKVMIFFLATSLSITILNSYDLISSLKWLTLLVANLYLFIILFSYFNKNGLEQTTFENTAILLCLPGIIQWLCIQLNLTIPFLSQTHGFFYRINGLSYYSNFFTVAISLFLPFILFKKKLTNHTMITLFLSFFMIIQSTSRTGILLLTFLIFIKLLTNSYISKNKLKILAILTLSVFSGLIIPEKTLNNSNKSGLDKISFFANELKLTPATSPLERTYIATQGLKVFADFPLFGVGPLAYENFILKLDSKSIEKYYSKSLRKSLYWHHENIWIELLACNGAIFSIIFLLFIICNITKNIFRNPLSYAASVSLLTYYFLAGQFVQNVLYPPVFVIWAILGYSITHENNYHHSDI